MQKASYDLYKEALSRGIAKECARFLLPESATTTLYMNGSVRSWIHYLQLRSERGVAQDEHCDIADMIRVIFSQEFPTVSTAVFGE